MESKSNEDLSVDKLLQQRRMLARGLFKAVIRLAELEFELYTDSLTGLANEKVFEKEFPRLVALAQFRKEPLALLVADVNGLKRANDTEGHATGDELLKRVARATRNSARPSDIPIRRSAGGDEFVVILPGFSPTPGQTEEDLFSNTVKRFENTYTEAVSSLGLREEVHAGVSFGIAILQGGESAQDLFRRADAMCMANKITVYEALRENGVKVMEDERRPNLLTE